MIFESFSPCFSLKEYVESYHLRHFIYPPGSVLPFKPYHGQPEQWLTFYIKDRETLEYVSDNKKIIRPRSLISGQLTTRVNRHIGNDFLVLIVEFQPGALYRLTGIPFHELTNTGIDAESVFSKEINLVNSRLNSTDNYREMIDIVETYLISKFNKLKLDGHSIDHIGKYIIKSPENVSLDKLAAHANLCPRQFERKFIERIGIGPKLFARMARFNKVHKIKYLHPGDDWLGIALACGYHDYPHLVRDCKEFAGTTPNIYFQQDTKAPERDFDFMKPEKYIVI
jgi:AraC-like DNA-binding protein